MRLIKGIRRKALHFIKDILGHLCRHAVFLTARHRHGSIVVEQPMQENLLLPLHYIVLLFAHRPPHNVGPPQGIARQAAENLHDLLLINNTAVSNIQNVLQQRVLILNPLRMMAALDIARDRIHGTGAVERDHRDQVFQPFRTQLHNYAAHTGRFKLKNPLHISRREHLINLRVVKVNFLQGKTRRFPADHFLRIVHDREVSQA